MTIYVQKAVDINIELMAENIAEFMEDGMSFEEAFVEYMENFIYDEIDDLDCFKQVEEHYEEIKKELKKYLDN